VALLEESPDNKKRKCMQLLFWILDGLAAGWLTGQFVSGNGRHLMMETMMGIAGAVGGGFIVSAAGLPVQGKMIFTNLAAVLGAVVMTALARLIATKREYASIHYVGNSSGM
jgi:uncharacterized membrane protein YeaQ/YmgE (transglycosylase-associated protein family)